MNRVLSFPQSHSCDNPAEVVSKRFCFSAIISVSFITLIMGYLLGSRYNQVKVDGTDKNMRINYIDFLTYSITNRKLDTVEKEKGITNYNEALMLEEHFKSHLFDEVMPIVSSKVTLTFKNDRKPDILEIIADEGNIRFQYQINATFANTIPTEADEANNFTNEVSGIPIYGNFGTEDDFLYIMEQGITVRNCILLLRLGKISIMEKVSAALKLGARGVLLFADPQQYPKTDNFSVQEEITPTMLTSILNSDNSLDETHFLKNCSVAIQIIESTTATNVLREMKLINKLPDSWQGALDTVYSIGPGFKSPNWKLKLYSHFISVRYTAYDIAASLRGHPESDRYIIVGSNRRSLKTNEEGDASTNALLLISKILAEAKTKGWQPVRTVLFCSFGLEDIEIYSSESWIRKHMNIIKEQTVAYINIGQPIQGFDYFHVEINSLLKNLFSNMSALVTNPIEKEKLLQKKTLFDAWQAESFEPNVQNYERRKEERKSVTDPEARVRYSINPRSIVELFDYFGVPTVGFDFRSRVPYQGEDERASNISSQDYEKSIHQLWTLLIFSLADNLIIPFDLTTYPEMLEDSCEKIDKEMSSKHSSLAPDFYRFCLAIQNLIPEVQKFQSQLLYFTSDSSLKHRILNDKLMLVGKLLACVKETSDLLLYEFDELIESIDQKLKKESLKRGTNCIGEILFALQNFLY